MSKNPIYDLALHESVNFSIKTQRDPLVSTITRVHGGWIYSIHDFKTAVFVPYTISSDEQIDNEGQLGNREYSEESFSAGKSTYEVAESLPIEVREAVSNLSQEQKDDLLKILRVRKLD